MNENYKMTLKILKSMDLQQLIELFHDLEDQLTVERILDSAQHYVDHGFDKESYKCHPDYEGDKELKEDDDRQRYQDIKSEQRSGGWEL